MNPSMKYQIIYLNGPSSSGKSTLAQALQDALDNPFLHIGIDKIIGLMPEKLNNWAGGIAPLGFSWKASIDSEGHPIQELQVGPFARKMSDTFVELVVHLAQMGHCLIIDDVALTNEELTTWKKRLQNFQVLYVGVKAPLAILEQREHLRGNRITGSARAQFHKLQYGTDYNLIVDTSQMTLEQCIEKISNYR